MANKKEPSKFSNEILDKLKSIFRINVNKNADNIVDKVRPAEKDKDSKFNRKDWDEESEKLYNWFWNTTHTDPQEYKNRIVMYEDMDVLFLNCPSIAKSAEIICDEIIQADNNNQPIFVDAKRPVKKFIEDFFDKININYYLRQTIKDFVKYGNAVWILEFDEEGVSKIIPISPYDLVDRIEFTPYEVRKKKDNGDKFLSEYRQLDRMEQYINEILSKDSSASYFDSYLMGYQIDDKVIPPWKCLHFRNMTNDAPFKPYGVPMFIHAMSPYRQYDAAMSLQITARGMRFPKNHFKLTFPNHVAPSDKLEAAIEFMSDFQNSGLGLSKKEVPGIGDNIISIADLFEYDQIVPDIDLGKIDDIEMLMNDVYNACIVPRNLIDPNDSGFGDSGISLVEKFKPFARFVYRCQNFILEQITQLVKIDMITSGSKFATDDVNFILSMPYPESQTNGDIISSQNDLLDLANNTIEALSDRLLGGEAVPPEIVKQIYTKFLPYDDDIIERWVNDVIKVKQGSEKEEEDNFLMVDDSLDFSDEEKSVKSFDKKIDKTLQFESKIKESRNRWKMLETKLGKVELKEEVSTRIFETLYENIKEGVVCNRHLYSSKIMNPEFNPLNLRKYDLNKRSLFQEEEEYSLLQELDYVFTEKNSSKKNNSQTKRKKSTKKEENRYGR